MRRIVGYLLMGLGLVVGVLGVLSGTVWKPDTTVSARTENITAPAVVVGPNERELVSTEVKVQITGAKDAKFFVIGAAPADLQAWLGKNAYQKVTGLQDWHTLALADYGSGDLPKPAHSDLWQIEKTASGTFTLSGADLAAFRNLDMLIMSDGVAAAPALTLTWPREASAPFMWPGVALGALLLVVGILVVIDDRQRRAREARRRARQERRRRRLEQLEAQTAVIPKVDVSKLAAPQLATGSAAALPPQPPTQVAATPVKAAAPASSSSASPAPGNTPAQAAVAPQSPLDRILTRPPMPAPPAFASDSPAVAATSAEDVAAPAVTAADKEETL